MTIHVRKVRVLRNMLLLLAASCTLLWLGRDAAFAGGWPAVFLGAGCGALYGRWYWQHLLRRVQRASSRHARNRVFVHFISPIEFLLVAIGWNLLMLLAVMLTLALLLASNWLLGGWLSLLLGSVGISATSMILAMLWRHERQSGPLYYQYRSNRWAGAEGLLYEKGTALTDLAPEGRVRIHAETWQARSIDGTTIPAGSDVEVLDRSGLCLMVDRPDAPPDNEKHCT